MTVYEKVRGPSKDLHCFPGLLYICPCIGNNHTSAARLKRQVDYVKARRSSLKAVETVELPDVEEPPSPRLKDHIPDVAAAFWAPGNRNIKVLSCKNSNCLTDREREGHRSPRWAMIKIA
jgi:hypothetical protein